MASTTPNIGLTLPTGAEKVSRQIINTNNTIIDSKIGAVPSGKNLQGEVDALNSNFTVSSLSQLVDGTVTISGDTNWHTASGTFNVNYKKYFIRIGPNGTVYNSAILDKQELDRLSSGNTFRISTYWDANNVGMISVHGNEYSITAKCKDYAFTYYIGGMN